MKLIAAIIEQANLLAGIEPGAEVTADQSAAAISIAREMASAVGQIQGLVESRRVERARIKIIMMCDQARGKADLADYLAFETTMSADEAIKTLASTAVVRKKLSLLDAITVQLESAGKTDSVLDADLNVVIDRLVASRFRESN